MKNKELTRIINMLQNIYNGAPWHGPSIMEILDKINAVQAFQESEHIHRICELVQHIIAWRIFTIKRLQGEQSYEISQKENWKVINGQDEGAWELIKSDLASTQRELIDALRQINDELLDEEVDAKAYDYYTLIHGVLQHDLYHLGEIALLAKETNYQEG
jgi:hypothetical protein